MIKNCSSGAQRKERLLCDGEEGPRFEARRCGKVARRGEPRAEQRGTLLDHARAFWHNIAPEMPDDLLTRVGFAFKAQRQVIASQRNLDLARHANRTCHWDGHTVGFIKMPFGQIVFSPPLSGFDAELGENLCDRTRRASACSKPIAPGGKRAIGEGRER
jgi:hypothetical protein